MQWQRYPLDYTPQDYPYLVGHVSVDGDCIAALWLLKTFGVAIDSRLANAGVKLVHTGTPDPEILANALAVVDTGKVYDPATLRFDHHLEGEFFADKSATMLVYSWLDWHAQQSGDIERKQDLQAIVPLVDIINRGDLGSKDLDIQMSRRVGLHAMISGLKLTQTPDHRILEQMFLILDTMANNLLNQATARREITAKTRRVSGRDGLLLWLDQASSTASHLAMEDGVKAIFFTTAEPDSNGQMTYARGIQVDPAYIGADKIVPLAIEICDNNRLPDAADELRSWFIHPQRFFAGKGTRKAPCHTAMEPWVEDALWIAIAQAFNTLFRAKQEPVPCE